MKSKNIIRAILLFGICFNLTSCNGDDAVENPTGNIPPNVNPTTNFDPAIVSGRYRGTWRWALGLGPISMVVKETSENVYAVDFYETANFSPCCNSNDSTPDMIGELNMSGQNADINLVWQTDVPPCKGISIWSETRDIAGKFVLLWDIIHDCTDAGAEGTEKEQEGYIIELI